MRRDTRVQVEVFTETNNFGEISTPWDAERSIWVSIDKLSGKEQIRAGTVEAKQSATMRADYFDAKDIGTDQRVSFDGAVWSIAGPPDEIGYKEALEFVIRLEPGETPA